MWFALKFWKEIFIVLIVISLVASAYGFKVHYDGLKADKLKLTSEIAVLKDDIGEFSSTITGLDMKMRETNADITRYINTIKKLQHITNEIQSKYNTLLEKIDNVKLPLNNNGTLSKPVILIHPGLPSEYLEFKATQGNSDKGNP